MMNLYIIKELHDKFQKEFPVIKISLSAFTKLRPRCCIPIGKKGSHNVLLLKHDYTLRNHRRIIWIYRKMIFKKKNFSLHYISQKITVLLIKRCCYNAPHC